MENEYPKMLYPQKIVVGSLEEERRVLGITATNELKVEVKEAAVAVEAPIEEIEPVKPKLAAKRKKKE